MQRSLACLRCVASRPTHVGSTLTRLRLPTASLSPVLQRFTSTNSHVVESRYLKQVEAGELELNPKQVELCQSLDKLYDDLVSHTPPSNNWFTKLFAGEPAITKGLYIWGKCSLTSFLPAANR